MRLHRLIAILVIISLLALTLTGCGGNGNEPTGSDYEGDSPAVQATLTFAAGEWYAQQTAIADKATPQPPSPGLSK